MAKGTYNILVVCTGNICRSPMAEGMLKEKLPERLAGRVAISSAGTHALHGNRAQPHAIAVMQGLGIDISGHRARQLSGALVRSSDLVLVMEKFHLRPVKMKSMLSSVRVRMLTAYEANGEPYDVPDPIGQPITAYEASAAIIDNCVKGVYAYLDTIIKTT
jgi:protein-tyrosine phosphatase